MDSAELKILKRIC